MFSLHGCIIGIAFAGMSGLARQFSEAKELYMKVGEKEVEMAC